MGGQQRGTGHISKHPFNTMFQRYVSYLQYNYHHLDQHQVLSGAIGRNPQSGIIQIFCCPVYASDVDLSTFLYAA